MDYSPHASDDYSTPSRVSRLVTDKSRPATLPLATRSSSASGPTARDRRKLDSDEYRTHSDSPTNTLDKTVLMLIKLCRIITIISVYIRYQGTTMDILENL